MEFVLSSPQRGAAFQNFIVDLGEKKKRGRGFSETIRCWLFGHQRRLDELKTQNDALMQIELVKKKMRWTSTMDEPPFTV